MRGTEQRLKQIEEQLRPDVPCTCKTLIATQEADGTEVVMLPACGQHKRLHPVEVLRLRGVSIADL